MGLAQNMMLRPKTEHGKNWWEGYCSYKKEAILPGCPRTACAKMCRKHLLHVEDTDTRLFHTV